MNPHPQNPATGQSPKLDPAQQAAVLYAAIRVASHDIKNAIGIMFLQLELAARIGTAEPAQVVELLASVREESRAVLTSIDALDAAVTLARMPPESPQ